MMKSIFKYNSFGKWIFKSSSPSTNDEMVKSIPQTGLNTNIVLYTHTQTFGKGQIGKKWYSGVNTNLTFTLFFPIQNLKARNQWILNMILSLLLGDWISSFTGYEASIKWPNDIYIKNKKVAGTLILNSIKSDDIFRSMAGVGINVNQGIFPQDLPNPISLKNLTGIEYDLNDTLKELLLYLEKNLHRLGSLKSSDLKTKYEQSMYLLNTPAKYLIIEEGKIYEGKILGVSDTGFLKMEIEGKNQQFNFREIEYII